MEVQSAILKINYAEKQLKTEEMATARKFRGNDAHTLSLLKESGRRALNKVGHTHSNTHRCQLN